ncbi:hypothetical protein LTR95_015845, partial [Oleoguttula sp. CCFEE 5521]
MGVTNFIKGSAGTAPPDSKEITDTSSGSEVVHDLFKPKGGREATFDASSSEVSFYAPIESYEGIHRYDPKFEWEPQEERRIVRKIDYKICAWVCFMFFALQLDRGNISQALSDNMLKLTKIRRTGQTIFYLSFLCAELPSQLISKKLGPDNWIPIQMVSWSLVASCQAFMKGRSGFWACRVLLEGTVTGLIGIVSWFYLPPSPTQTASKFRGKDGWFNEREEKIMVNRILRDDPSKGSMHNRQALTPKMLWRCFCDYHMWPIYLIGICWLLPSVPISAYLTLNLKAIGFKTFTTNLLVIPAYVLFIINLLFFTWLTERLNERFLLASISQWVPLPLLIALECLPATRSHWVTYALSVLLFAQPYFHAVLVAITSRNAGSVRTRTVASALYNMTVQAGNIIGSNIYREHDKPLYYTGNKVLIALCCFNLCLFYGAKIFYVTINKRRAAKWDAMTKEEREHYLTTTKDEGNKSDLHEYLGGPAICPTTPHPITGEQVPLTFGHEFSGTVEEVGEGVTKFKAGDRVCVQPIIYDDECGSCKEGLINCCDKNGFVGLSGWGGGLSEHVVLPEYCVIPIPDNVPLDVAALVEPLSVGWHAVAISPFKKGDSALVIGGGPIGLSVIQALKAKGCDNIIVTEVSSMRKQYAQDFGAHHILDPTKDDIVARCRELSDNQGVHMAFDAAGVQAALT